jgi:hypothetical protein
MTPRREPLTRVEILLIAAVLAVWAGQWLLFGGWK